MENSVNCHGILLSDFCGNPVLIDSVWMCLCARSIIMSNFVKFYITTIVVYNRYMQSLTFHQDEVTVLDVYTRDI